jgi:hypothetical protein
MESELLACIPDEVAFFLASKLRYFFQRNAYGEIRLKMQEGRVHTMHFTESFRVKKRVRRNDQQNNATTTPPQE